MLPVRKCEFANGGAAIRTSSAIRTEKIKFNSMKNYTYGGFEKKSKHRGSENSIYYFELN